MLIISAIPKMAKIVKDGSTIAMSWKVMDQIFGLIAIDKEFAQEILEHPLEAIEKRGFTLTHEEREALNKAHTDNIISFSRQILEYLEYGL